MHCIDSAHDTNQSYNPDVSIFLCLISMSGCLGHTSLLASNATWLEHKHGGFTALSSLQLSICVIMRSLHHLNSAHSPCRAEHLNNKQTSPGILAFILPSKEKTEVSLSMHR